MTFSDTNLESKNLGFAAVLDKDFQMSYNESCILRGCKTTRGQSWNYEKKSRTQTRAASLCWGSGQRAEFFSELQL